MPNPARKITTCHAAGSVIEAMKAETDNPHGSRPLSIPRNIDTPLLWDDGNFRVPSTTALAIGRASTPGSTLR